MRSTRLLAVLVAATATVAVMSGTAYAAPAPTYWQGSYPASPFYGRQIVRDSPNNYCPPPAFPLSLLFAVTATWYCPAQAVSPAETPGGDFIAESAICIADGSKDYTTHFGNWENKFEIYDDTAGVVVREWTEPSTYAAHDFTLHGGDCATWLWNIPMVQDDGTPLTSGHTHHLLFHQGPGAEQNSAYFTAP